MSSSEAKQAAREWGRDCLPRGEERTPLRPASARSSSSNDQEKARLQRPVSAVARPDTPAGSGLAAKGLRVAPEKARRGLGSAQRRRLRALSSGEQNRAPGQSASAKRKDVTYASAAPSGYTGTSTSGSSWGGGHVSYRTRDTNLPEGDTEEQDVWDVLEAKARAAEHIIKERQSRPSSAMPRGPITDEEEDIYVGKTVNQTELIDAMKSWKATDV